MSSKRTELHALLDRVRDLKAGSPERASVAADCLRMFEGVAIKLIALRETGEDGHIELEEKLAASQLREHDLRCVSDRIQRNLRDAGIMHPEHFHKESLEQLLGEWIALVHQIDTVALHAYVERSNRELLDKICELNPWIDRKRMEAEVFGAAGARQ